ncbi:dehydrogenase [Paenibacillus sp. FJAT-26967]|uniref:dehydrogenase n=1 Tax=Paenibacillus sp. FJAT-26967 TaxID=1729690 RepID=UPI000838D7CA|nr:dehydrogenase [Paenibacillus sp. FJAT-26967]
MRHNKNEKHKTQFPSVRGIRRACSRELYRTIKRLKVFIPADKVEQAEKIYARKVAENIAFIVENSDNHKVQADWWEEKVAPEIAELWGVPADVLAGAFRHSYGG